MPSSSKEDKFDTVFTTVNAICSLSKEQKELIDELSLRDI